MAVLGRSVVVGIVLGGLAAGADRLAGGSQGAGLAMLLVSSGLSWGVAAAVMGARSDRPVPAVAAGTGALLSAVASYYLLVGPLGGRDSSDAALWSAGLVWAVVAVPAGAVCGAAGWLLRWGGRRGRTAAAAVLAGALMAPSLSVLTRSGAAYRGVDVAVVVAVLAGVALVSRRLAVPAVAAAVVLGLVGSRLWPVVLQAIR